MQHAHIIAASLTYIEQNLKTTITAEELAKRAGYSLYYYCRLFSSVVHSSVASYILKRRLDHALAEITQGQKAIDVVLAYGFETYSGFYKAFVKMYGCSPRKYLAIYHSHIPTKPEVTIMYSEKELRAVLQSWDIDTAIPIGGVPIVLEETRLSENCWTVGEEYLLKTGGREQLLRGSRIAKALAAQGFSAPYPIPTKSGAEYREGQEIFILTNKPKGIPLPRAERIGSRREAYGILYGKSLAGLHKALANIQPDIPADDANLWQTVSTWAMPEVFKQNVQWDMQLPASFFEDYAETFAGLYPQLPRQLIHRDPHPGNILFDAGTVSGFGEFDLGEINIRLWDVCYCATGILSEMEEEAYSCWLDILAGIVSGYDSENPLTAEEKQAIYYVICSIEMICIAFFESRDIFRELAKTNRRMLVFLAGKAQEIKNIR